jgi:hypothetical protein
MPVGVVAVCLRIVLWWWVFRGCGVLVRPVSSGWAGFPRAGGSFVFVGAGGSVVQGKAARMRCQAVAIAVAQRQVASMRRRSWRAPRVIRAAVCKTR